jgi:hypothetical protein
MSADLTGRKLPTAPYRGEELRAGMLLTVVAGLVLLVLLAGAGNWVLFGMLEDREMAAQRPASPFDDIEPAVPVPALQVDPPADLAALEAEMDRLLGEYAWVDPERDLVRIPIERAIELAGREGLPVFDAAAEGGVE